MKKNHSQVDFRPKRTVLLWIMCYYTYLMNMSSNWWHHQWYPASNGPNSDSSTFLREKNNFFLLKIAYLHGWHARLLDFKINKLKNLAKRLSLGGLALVLSVFRRKFCLMNSVDSSSERLPNYASSSTLSTVMMSKLNNSIDSGVQSQNPVRVW